MGKHDKFKHPHVTGETDPVKIKRELERIRREAAEAAERSGQEQNNPR